MAASPTTGRTPPALAICDVEGRLLHRLADRYARVFQPGWSPGGTWIAVSVREAEGRAADILLLPAPRAPPR